jgi:hypothetical protein
MDGENTTMYRDGIHARSTEWRGHPSRNWVSALHASIQWEIPEGWRVCGENLYAKHSIHYQGLPSYFMVFSVWNEHNVCLSWSETKEWAALLGLEVAPVLYEGVWNEATIRGLYQPRWFGNEMEGYVVRLASEFSYGQFRWAVAKYVRESHVQTSPHWMWGQPVVPNELNAQTKVVS